ncbi:hypothetical protein F4775DRAFT_595220 [Biscogniauxia sp. FL1348]|nr:hypothetical protein F4775DRAFT_595220 [Biscogniauxia sp. FL1348]
MEDQVPEGTNMSPSVPNYDKSLELEPLQFGSVHVRMASNPGEEDQLIDHTREGQFLRDAAAEALMVFTTERVQADMKALVEELLGRRNIFGWSEYIVDDFIASLFTKELTIYCGSLPNPRQLFVACPYLMAPEDSQVGYIIFNKLYITQVCENVEILGQDPRWKTQLSLDTIVGFVQGWAETLAYNAIVNGLLPDHVVGEERAFLARTFWSGPDIIMDYVKFGHDLVHSVLREKLGSSRSTDVQSPPAGCY